MKPSYLTLIAFCAWSVFFTSCQSPKAEEELQIEYIAHASFKLTYQDHSLLIDPFADTIWIGYKFPKNVSANAVLISHPHYDHDGGRFRGIKPYWEDQMQIIEEPGTYNVGGFKITGIKGKHSDPYGKEFGQKNTIWLIEVADLKVVHLGDNELFNTSQYEALGEVDLLMAPIDGDYHILKPDEIEEIVDRLGPKILIPMHYRHPDLEEEGFPKGGLGNIDPYLKGKSNVEQLSGHTTTLTKSDLPQSMQIMVFKHSPDVYR